MKKLFLNYIYYNPVGHAVEALKYSKGFKNANNVEIHVALNKYTPTELTKACPWITATYPVDIYEFLGDPSANVPSLKTIPKNWDYIVTNNLVLLDNQGVTKLGRDEEAMINYLNLTENFFKTSLGKGTIFPKMSLPRELQYEFDPKINLNLPQESLNFARKYEHDGPKICVMLGGSGEYKSYPNIETWIKIFHALNNTFPNLKMYLTGVRPTTDGRTSTGAYTENQIQTVLGELSNMMDCYDIGLWNQLALIQKSDVFLSPHTGFAFLAPCVDTPWLAISGGDWPEYFFNHVPFYSVLPDDPEYPYQCKLNKYDNAAKILSMEPVRLESKIPEIIEGVKLLLSKEFTYEKALERHRLNIDKSTVVKKKIPTGSGF